ncbi:hypothetical protein, partial [Chitinivorax sp. B]|uniref:hypothetical protein n=1 Tax=Chitinivorax sp. B TaxID=2502235 RepID=UPI0010F8DFC1
MGRYMRYLSMRTLNKSQRLLAGLLGIPCLIATAIPTHAALAPVPEAVSRLVQSRLAPSAQDTLATRLDHELAQLQAVLNRRRPAMAAFLPLPAGVEQPLDTASFSALLTRRLAALQLLRQDTAARIGAMTGTAGGELQAQVEQRFEGLRQDLTAL